MPPTFNLDDIKRLAEQAIEDPKKGTLVFPAPRKSIHSVINTMRGRGLNLNSVKAQTWICYRLLDLTPDHFYQSEAGQWGDLSCVTDQYGIRYEGIPWFIKFRIEAGKLEEISCHPLERDMTLASGTVLKKEWSSK
jgi:hypothetical protein